MTNRSLDILIIDDDEIDRMRITRALKSDTVPHAIIEAGDSDAGIEAAQSQRFDCIFLDYLLPGTDGLEVLRHLRQNDIDTPVIMLTGQGDTRLAVELMKAGASDYIAKDALTPELLQRSLMHVVQLREAELEAQRAQEEQAALLKKLKEAQSQLLQSEKLASIGQLAAGVAHEINNPVGYVSSNITSLKTYIDDLLKVIEVYEQLEQDPASADALAQVKQTKEAIDLSYLREDIAELLAESSEGVNRVREIVQDLKDFSHVNEAEWQMADLHKGLDSTLNIVANEIKYKADVVKEYGQLPEIKCIASQINQVFMNLLVNAAHAIGDERGTITIRSGINEKQVWVEIQDSGKGIAAEDMTRIFDPFFTTKEIGKGTGLGLSLSYGIIQKHKGKIDVQSTLGQGTRFIISLPIEQDVALD